MIEIDSSTLQHALRREGRTSDNPRTGVAVTANARRAVMFRASSKPIAAVARGFRA